MAFAGVAVNAGDPLSPALPHPESPGVQVLPLFRLLFAAQSSENPHGIRMRAKGVRAEQQHFS